MQISIDGSTAEIHDKLRGKGTFKKAINGVKRVKAAGNLGLSIACTITKRNLYDTPRMLHLAQYLGVPVSFSPFAGIGRGADSYRELSISNSDLLQFYVNLFQEFEDLGFPEDVFRPFEYETEILSVRTCCGGASRLTSIEPDGSVYPCHLLRRPEYRMGNIFNDDIEAIINSSEEARRQLAIHVDKREGCSSCDVRYFCGGGCPGETLGSTGCLAAHPPRCDFNRSFYSAIAWGYNPTLSRNENIRIIREKLMEEMKCCATSASLS